MENGGNMAKKSKEHICPITHQRYAKYYRDGLYFSGKGSYEKWKETQKPKPLPAVGTSISNPLDLSGGNHNVFSVIEKLYGDIGYFILSEQILPTKEQTIKLVQLKIDDGRYVNLFIKL